jgi:hypothetical protein
MAVGRYVRGVNFGVVKPVNFLLERSVAFCVTFRGQFSSSVKTTIPTQKRTKQLLEWSLSSKAECKLAGPEILLPLGFRNIHRLFQQTSPIGSYPHRLSPVHPLTCHPGLNLQSNRFSVALTVIKIVSKSERRNIAGSTPCDVIGCFD